jgi:hypothetical protein
VKGFSRKETVAYCRGKSLSKHGSRLSAQTPEVRAEKYSEAADWTMLDKDYDGRTRRTFGTGPVFMPSWWWRTDPTISHAGTSARTMGGSVAKGSATAPSGGGKSTTVTLPSLPGSDAAASVIGSVQAFSSGVVGNIAAFTGAVTTKTNPCRFKHQHLRGSGGGFQQWRLAFLRQRVCMRRMRQRLRRGGAKPHTANQRCMEHAKKNEPFYQIPCRSDPGNFSNHVRMAKPKTLHLRVEQEGSAFYKTTPRHIPL